MLSNTEIQQSKLLKTKNTENTENPAMSTLNTTRNSQLSNAQSLAQDQSTANTSKRNSEQTTVFAQTAEQIKQTNKNKLNTQIKTASTQQITHAESIDPPTLENIFKNISMDEPFSNEELALIQKSSIQDLIKFFPEKIPNNKRGNTILEFFSEYNVEKQEILLKADSFLEIDKIKYDENLNKNSKKIIDIKCVVLKSLLIHNIPIYLKNQSP